MNNKDRLKMMEESYEFELKKKMIFDKTSELACLIDKRNDFFEYAGSVSEVIESANLTKEKNFELQALKSGASRIDK